MYMYVCMSTRARVYVHCVTEGDEMKYSMESPEGDKKNKRKLGEDVDA